MRSKMGKVLSRHGRENVGLYLFMIGSFIIGIILGTLAVEALDVNQEGQLSQYLDWFFQEISRLELDNNQVVIETMLRNIGSIALIAFLGLTVIGAPIILLVILLRGFVLGFTVGFLVQEKAAVGILIAITSIFPQNLINIPAWIVAGVAAVSFSLMLIRGTKKEKKTVWQSLLSYLTFMGILTLVAVVGALVEIYISPIFLRLLAGYFL